MNDVGNDEEYSQFQYQNDDQISIMNVKFSIKALINGKI
jgi:hypothetical protein